MNGIVARLIENAEGAHGNESTTSGDLEYKATIIEY
jgi:hypothetical protein